MDSKLLNYSKLQIPILNGLSSHNYVIMPALLSQIDSTLSSTTTQNSDDMSSSNLYPSIYINSDNSSNNISETVFISSPSSSNNHYKRQPINNRNSKKINSNKNKSYLKSHKNYNSKINYDGSDKVDMINLIDINENPSELHYHDNRQMMNYNNCTSLNDDIIIEDDDIDNEDEEVDEEDLGLNSISKFIYKETESLIDSFANNESLNANTVDSFTNSEIIRNDNDTMLNSNNNNINDPGLVDTNVIDLQNDESVTYIVNCSLMPDIDLNQMMNCYVALNKLNDDNIGSYYIILLKRFF
jgi:hypothetical protein